MIADLVTWLRARLDEDERTWAMVIRGPRKNGKTFATHMLREVEAKRRILDRCIQARADQGIYCEDGQEAVAEDVLQLLAELLDDRDGYREEWRPA